MKKSVLFGAIFVSVGQVLGQGNYNAIRCLDYSVLASGNYWTLFDTQIHGRRNIPTFVFSGRLHPQHFMYAIIQTRKNDFS